MFFLRVKKFSMQKAYESFEYTIPFIKSHPDLYSNLSPSDYEFTTKPNSPFIFLKNRDSERRRIIILRCKHFDSFDSIEYLRRAYLTALLASCEIDTQLNGVVIIFDCSDINLAKLSRIPLNSVYDSFRFGKLGIIRPKLLNIIGMPLFLKPIFEMAKSFTSAKILERINFINKVDELSEHIDVSVLPKEYGGSSDELMDYEPFELGVAYFNKIHKFDVNFSKIQNYENVGSFRKLEID